MTLDRASSFAPNPAQRLTPLTGQRLLHLLAHQPPFGA
jgi:hypothetical protein